MQNKKSSHFISLFHHFFTFTLYSNTSHALFGILYHELTSQNEGNDVQLPATCCNQSRIERSHGDPRDYFFHALASAQLLGCLVTSDTQISDSTPHTEGNDDMSVLVAVIHFRVGFTCMNRDVEFGALAVISSHVRRTRPGQEGSGDTNRSCLLY